MFLCVEYKAKTKAQYDVLMNKLKVAEGARDEVAYRSYSHHPGLIPIRRRLKFAGGRPSL